MGIGGKSDGFMDLFRDKFPRVRVGMEGSTNAFVGGAP